MKKPIFLIALILILDQLYPLYNSLYKDGNPAGIKECLSYLEICQSDLRLPLVNVEQSTREELIKITESLKAS